LVTAVAVTSTGARIDVGAAGTIPDSRARLSAVAGRLVDGDASAAQTLKLRESMAEAPCSTGADPMGRRSSIAVVKMAARIMTAGTGRPDCA
jgi:hypothetical protein